jgi:MMPL family
MVTLKSEDQGVGESRAANRVSAREFPRVRAPEEVLIESRTGRFPATDYRAAVQSLVARLSRVPAVAEIKSPLQRGNAGQVSRDGTSALITFQITGDPDTAKNRVGPALAATAAVQAAHPRLFVGEMGEASANMRGGSVIRAACRQHQRLLSQPSEGVPRAEDYVPVPTFGAASVIVTGLRADWARAISTTAAAKKASPSGPVGGG